MGGIMGRGYIWFSRVGALFFGPKKEGVWRENQMHGCATLRGMAPYLQIIFSALACTICGGLWALFVEGRIAKRDKLLDQLGDELKTLRDDRLRRMETDLGDKIVTVEKRLTGLHASKDRLASEVEEKLADKVAEKQLHRELAHISEKMEQANLAQSKFESEVRNEMRGLHAQGDESATLLRLIARRLNVSLKGGAEPQD